MRYNISRGEKSPLKRTNPINSNKSPTKNTNQSSNLRIHNCFIKFQSAATVHRPTLHAQTSLGEYSTGHLPSVEGYQSLAGWMRNTWGETNHPPPPKKNHKCHLKRDHFEKKIVFQPTFFHGKRLVFFFFFGGCFFFVDLEGLIWRLPVMDGFYTIWTHTIFKGHCYIPCIFKCVTSMRCHEKKVPIHTYRWGSRIVIAAYDGTSQSAMRWRGFDQPRSFTPHRFEWIILGTINMWLRPS